jgi:hypothetical protein
MRRARIGLAAAVGVLGAVASFLITTPPGPGLDPDAMQYLGAAESLVRRGTLRIPVAEWDSGDSTSALQHFPPGIPLLVAPGVAVGLPAVQSARLVQTLAAGATLALAFWIVSGVAGMSGGALAALLLLAMPAMASDHIRVLSEPLFLALFLLTLGCMARLPERALGCGLAAAAAGLVRYAGFALSGAGALVALWRGGPTWRGRLRLAAQVAVPGVLAQLAWSLRTRLEGGSVRSIALNTDLTVTLKEGWRTLLEWLAPQIGPSFTGVVVAVLVAALGALLVTRAAARAPALFGSAGTSALCYAALVLLSRIVADPDIPFDDRMLSPLMVLAALAVAAAAPLVLPTLRRPVRGAAAATLAAWIAASGVATVRFVRMAREGGWGYAITEWPSSNLVGWLRADGVRHTLYTNNTAGVWFFTHRPARTLPDSYDRGEVAEFADTLRAERGVIVAFRDGYDTAVVPDSVARLLGLRELFRSAEGAIFGP